MKAERFLHPSSFVPYRTTTGKYICALFAWGGSCVAINVGVGVGVTVGLPGIGVAVGVMLGLPPV